MRLLRLFSRFPLLPLFPRLIFRLFPGLLLRILFMATFMGVGAFLVFRWAEPRMSIEEARTVTFCTIVAFEWFRAFNARSDEYTIFRLGLFSNRWLLMAIAIAIALQVFAIYAPFMQVAFRTVPLTIEKWGIALLAAGSLFVIEETRKALFPRLFSLGKWQPLNRA